MDELITNDGEVASRRTSARIRLPFGALAVVLLFFLCPNELWAHARLLRSEPTDKAKLNKPPHVLELWFSELLEDGFNTVEVYTADKAKNSSTTPKQTSLTEGKPELDGHDHTHLRIHLKALKPGDYVVEWRVLSRDGHSAPGRFTFKMLATP